MIKFPTNRPYSEIEALVDYFCNVKRGFNEVRVSYSGLAKQWGWSKTSVCRFVKEINLERFWNENGTLLRLKNSELTNSAGTKVKRKRNAPKPNSIVTIDYPADLFREGLIYPFNTILFRGAWKQWIEYKWNEHRDRYKALKTEQITINRLFKVSAGNEQRAVDMIEGSISNKWQGIYEDRTVREKYGTTKRREKEIHSDRNKEPKDTWTDNETAPKNKDDSKGPI
jgi:hypothetical protein